MRLEQERHHVKVRERNHLIAIGLLLHLEDVLLPASLCFGVADCSVWHMQACRITPRNVESRPVRPTHRAERSSHALPMFSRAQPASLAGDCANTDETWAFVFYLVGDRAQARGLHSFCGRTRAPLCFQIAPALSIRGPQIEPKAKTKKTQMRRSAGRGPPGLL